MTKLRLQFLIFFILLQSGILFLGINSYRQMRIEERSLWESESTKVYNLMQAKISDLLNVEDARSFKDYRFFLSSENNSIKSLSQRSPLSDVLAPGYPSGWVGYFQMDPDGSFSTPYLPSSPDESRKLTDYEQRKQKQESLKQATITFRKDMERAFASRSFSEGQPKTLMTTGVGSKNVETFKDVPLKEKSSPNIYPNPIQTKQTKVLMQDVALDKAPTPSSPGASGSSGAFVSSGENAQLSRREESVKEDVIQNFAQTSSPVSAAAKPQNFVRKDEEKKVSSEIIDETAKPSKTAPKKKTLLIKTPSPVLSEASSKVWLDPFQAKVSGHYLVFFRRVWLGQNMYLQGFVLQTQPFFAFLMQNTFENSDLPNFSWVQWVEAQSGIAQYGQMHDFPQEQNVLFSRGMAYPLNSIQWNLMGKSWPKISTRLYMNILFGGIFLFASIGLYWIYRSSAAQVRLSQKRQDFVSAVTHELKTPLTSIRMYSEMLEDDWIKDESKKKEYYKNIHQESERLSRLIENVLQMARLEKQSYRLNLMKQNPQEDLMRWSKQFEVLAKKEGFQFHLHLETELSEMRYDPEALKEIFLIFLENSVKFSKVSSDNNLELKVRAKSGCMEFVWEDHGPGVPVKELSQIFEKFYRVENELTRKTKGTGIGLAIAKMMVEEMGAKIEARNGSVNGLEIVIRFTV